MEESLDVILTQPLKKEKLVTFLKKYPQKFDDAINIALSDKQPQAWRATWLLFHCMQDNDKRIKNHIKNIINDIRNCKDGHQREWLKILDRMLLTENQESLLFDVCLTIWEDITKSPSVRGTAFKFLLKIVKKYPELSEEIQHLTQSHYTESLSPGIRHSFFLMTKEMKLYRME
jgi:hypothetical protein